MFFSLWIQLVLDNYFEPQGVCKMLLWQVFQNTSFIVLQVLTINVSAVGTRCKNRAALKKAISVGYAFVSSLSS
jgi:hypothetical protein